MSTGAGGFYSQPFHNWRNTDLVLDPGGSLAWITDERPYSQQVPVPYTVKRCDATGCAELDRGNDIEPGSMALSTGSHLYWMRAGQPRAAAIE